jgi:hypothetical protein
MKQTPTPSGPAEDDRPWSPATLVILSLIFGLGAIVVTVRNLERLGVLEARLARFYFWATVVFLASVLLLIWSLDPHSFERSPAQQVAPLSIAAPFTVLVLQSAPFRRWRSEHPNLDTRPWFTALLPVIGMTLVTAALAVLAIQIFAFMFGRP